MKILIIGGAGQIGGDLREMCLFAKHSVSTFGPRGCDNLGNVGSSECNTVIRDWKPDVIFNCAAMHEVEACERRPDDAYNVNAFLHKNVIDSVVGSKPASKVIYISTDYVFPGGGGPYRIFDSPRPMNIYGMSKALGEYFTLKDAGGTVARLSYVFGHRPSRQKGGSNLVQKMLAQLKATKAAPEVKVSPGMMISLVSSKDAAKMLLGLVSKEPGIYHCVNEGSYSIESLSAIICSMVFPGAHPKMIEPPKEEDAKINNHFFRPKETALVPNVPTRPLEEALKDYLSELGEIPFFKEPVLRLSRGDQVVAEVKK